jgi:hypothetical protein
MGLTVKKEELKSKREVLVLMKFYFGLLAICPYYKINREE